MPLGMKVGLDPCHIVLDGDPASPPRTPSAHVYCGHGRPSQLLLSSCSKCSNEIGKTKNSTGSKAIMYESFENVREQL